MVGASFVRCNILFMHNCFNKMELVYLLIKLRSKAKGVSQYRECKECCCVLGIISVAYLPRKNKLGVQWWDWSHLVRMQSMYL